MSSVNFHSITSNHITSHAITSHAITSNHITSHAITSHAITSHKTTSYQMIYHFNHLGKSELGRRLASIGGGGLFFERLLTKYSNPEELFGPLSLSALERDEYVRNTDVRSCGLCHVLLTLVLSCLVLSYHVFAILSFIYYLPCHIDLVLSCLSYLLCIALFLFSCPSCPIFCLSFPFHHGIIWLISLCILHMCNLCLLP